MTDEFQQPAGELPSSPAAFTGSLESLGFGNTEQSPTAAIVLPAAEVAATSRRALRESERSASSHRSRRSAKRAPSHPQTTPTLPIAAAPAPRPVMRHGVQPSRLPIARRIAQRALPPTVMLAVAGLLIGTTVPANALFRPGDVAASTGLTSLATVASAEKSAEPTQVLELSTAAAAAAPVASRDDWTVTSYAESLRAKFGNRNFTYQSTGTGAVRWPFPYFAQISSPYGSRAAPCRGCSSLHQGIDMLGGDGMPVYAVADGVVSALQEDWSYGEHVFIEHEINGQRVTTLYAHMRGGSTMIVPGQEVKAGDPVGMVGNTGASTGPHLHLEVRLDGIKVDPYAWLVANAS